MKRLILFYLLMVSAFTYSQNEENDNLTKFGRINLGVHGIEFSYELPVSNKFVWENNLGIGLGMNKNGSIAQYYWAFNKPTPYLKSELKFVYNRNKRILKKRPVHNNSGNYIGLQAKYSFGNKNVYDLDETVLTEIHWGIQRNLGRRFLFNTHIGFGYLWDFDNSSGEISPTLGVRFGYRLF
ncbi:MAG: hypothetical protein DSY82_03200 [Flavobacteriia bacterium]|nr:MAG: hypothetical protein DSY82_03200 [Flavobacteriia bacterium]